MLAINLLLRNHSHDAEMRNAAREFHHTMIGTQAQNVSLCLDAQWIYRRAATVTQARFSVCEQSV